MITPLLKHLKKGRKFYSYKSSAKKHLASGNPLINSASNGTHLKGDGENVIFAYFSALFCRTACGAPPHQFELKNVLKSHLR